MRHHIRLLTNPTTEEAVTDLGIGITLARCSIASRIRLMFPDDEWGLVAPYLMLLPEGARQRQHSLREVFNGLGYLVRYSVAWRAMPGDLPPWHAINDQAQG